MKVNKLLIVIVILLLLATVFIQLSFKNNNISEVFHENYSLTVVNLTQKEAQVNYPSLGIIALLAISIVIMFYLLLTLDVEKEEKKDPIVTLTNMERKILILIQNDILNKEIANNLNISLSTVKTHISNIYKKLEVSSRSELINSLLEVKKEQ